jgi:hypothetical protein
MPVTRSIAPLSGTRCYTPHTFCLQRLCLTPSRSERLMPPERPGAV